MAITEIHGSNRLQIVVPHNHSRFAEVEQAIEDGLSGATDYRYDGSGYVTEFANGGSDALFATASGQWNTKLFGARVDDINAMLASLETEYAAEPTFTAALFERGQWIWVCDVSQPVPLPTAGPPPNYTEWFDGIHGTPKMRPWEPSDTPVTVLAIEEDQ
jgi:hypothetical protein